MSAWCWAGQEEEEERREREKGCGGFGPGGECLFEVPDGFVHGREGPEGGEFHVPIEQQGRQAPAGDREGEKPCGTAAAQEDVQAGGDLCYRFRDEQVTLPDTVGGCGR